MKKESEFRAEKDRRSGRSRAGCQAHFSLFGQKTAKPVVWTGFCVLQ
jgi:hypothetical protein